MSVDFVHLPDAESVDCAPLAGPFEAVEESAEPLDHALHGPLVLLGGRDDEVELLVAYPQVFRAAAVDQCLHLCAHRVEVDRRGEHDDVGFDHLLDDLPCIVVLRAGSARFGAGAASRTVVDGPVAQKDLFRVVPRLAGSAQELVAQRVGIAVAAGAG